MPARSRSSASPGSNSRIFHQLDVENVADGGDHLLEEFL